MNRTEQQPGNAPNSHGYGSKILLCAAFLALSGCLQIAGDEVDSADPLAPQPGQLSLGGSVGDGTASAASVSIFDVNGQMVAETTAAADASYSVILDRDAAFPLIVEASGGNGVLGQVAPDFTMRTVVFADSGSRANISPLTSLAYEIADCSSNTSTRANFEWALDLATDALGMGYSRAQHGDMSSASLSNGNIVPYALSNLAFYETVRRAAVSLSSTSSNVGENGIMAALGCDLADGSLDGAGSGVDTRIIVASIAASASVLMELGAQELQVNGSTAAPQVNSAIQSVLSGSGIPDAASFVPAATYRDQANKAMQVARRFATDTSLLEMIIAVSTRSGLSLVQELDDVLQPADMQTLNQVRLSAALASNSAVDGAASALASVDNAALPSLVLNPETVSVAPGTSVELAWSSQNADRCLARGAWSGEVNTSGTSMTEPVNEPKSFEVACVGLAGATVDASTISVGSGANPQIAFSASRLSVEAGTSVTLTWSTVNASSCTASGAWSGSRSVSGSEVVGPLTVFSSYTLSCQGAGGSAERSLGVSVLGQGGDYARGVPYPDFGWDPLTYDPTTTETTSSLPSVVNSGEVVLYTGTDGGSVRFDCIASSPCVLQGQGQTLDSDLRASGSHFVLKNFSFFNTSGSVSVEGTQSDPTSYAVIRDIDHGGDNTGSSNGVSMYLENAHDVVYFQNQIHNLRDDSGNSEVDYIGFVPRHNASNIWYLDNNVWRLGGDSMRTGTNVSRLDSGLTPPRNIFVARNQFHDNGENPIDLKYSTDIVISENDLYGSTASGSHSGEAIVIHESADDVYIFGNHIFDVGRGVVTATAGGGADYILVEDNLFEDISEIGVYNRGGGHADVFNNTFRNVSDPINNSSGNGSTITDLGNIIE